MTNKNKRKLTNIIIKQKKHLKTLQHHVGLVEECTKFFEELTDRYFTNPQREITKDDFFFICHFLKTRMELDDEFGNFLSTITEGFSSSYGTPFVSKTINFLDKYFGGDWVSWWFYETNCGHGDHLTTKDNLEQQITVTQDNGKKKWVVLTPNELWDLIHNI